MENRKKACKTGEKWMYKEFDFETYPQVIHFLWITVDKSVHTNNTALTGIKSDRTGENKKDFMLDYTILFLYNLMRMFLAYIK